MGFLKKLLAGGLLTFGSIFLIAAIAVPFDPDLPKGEKISTTLGCLILGAPPVTWSGWLFLSMAAEKRRKQEQLQLQRRGQIQRSLLQLAAARGGEITLAQFVMESGLDHDEAKTHMDQAAEAFGANFRVGDRGEIYYQFPLN